MEGKGITRQQLADMYGWSTKTQKRILLNAGVLLPSGTITPKWLEIIITKLGTPPNLQKYKGFVKL